MLSRAGVLFGISLPLFLVLHVATASGSGDVTLKDANDFGARLEKTVAAGDASFFGQAVDMSAMVDKALEGLDVPPKLRDELVDANNNSLAFVQKIVDQTKEGGSYHLLRVLNVKGDPQPLFRMVLAQGGVNYHQLVLGHDKQGNIRIVDMGVFTSGELMSETLRRSFIPVVAQANRGILARLAGSESEYMQSAPQILQMEKLANGGKYAEALEMYGKLPESVRNERMILMLRIMYAEQSASTDSKPYEDAMTDYIRLYPNATNCELLGMDFLLLRKRYGDVLKTIDRLDQRLGGDPSLNVQRATAYVQENDEVSARRVLEKGISEEPALPDLYWSLIDIALSHKNHAETARLLTALESHTKLRLGDLSKVPVYADFCASPEYQAWKAQHEANK